MKASVPLRVLVADDHPVVRNGLVDILRRAPGISVVGEAADGAAACRLYEEWLPAMALVDLRMPKVDGLATVRHITTLHPDARILIMTTYDGEEDVFRCFRAGARGYLLKDAPEETIVEAVRDVAAGKHYMPAPVADKFALRSSRPNLTEREFEVLEALATGKCDREIGGDLAISEWTVKSHVKSVLDKLDALSRTEAVVLAMRRGLLHL